MTGNYDDIDDLDYIRVMPYEGFTDFKLPSNVYLYSFMAVILIFIVFLR
jgi:hypothetical protein